MMKSLLKDRDRRAMAHLQANAGELAQNNGWIIKTRQHGACRAGVLLVPDR
jgi:hypothetical protein